MSALDANMLLLSASNVCAFRIPAADAGYRAVDAAPRISLVMSADPVLTYFPIAG